MTAGRLAERQFRGAKLATQYGLESKHGTKIMMAKHGKDAMIAARETISPGPPNERAKPRPQSAAPSG
jgi:hypothetical protein